MTHAEDPKEKLIDHLYETEGRSEPNDQTAKEWIQSSDENNKTWQDFKKIWRRAGILRYFNSIDTSKDWQLIDRKIRERNRKVRYLTQTAYLVSGMAASVLIMLMLNVLSPDYNHAVTVSTKWGDRSDVVLPDGSSVSLNSGSILSYRYDSNNKIRLVEFAGEGFFQVSKSKSPFVIKVPHGLELKVLGTKFNIQAYPEDQFSRTALTEGKVELTTAANQVLVLSPGQVAAFDKRNEQLTLDPADPDRLLSWMDNKLYMDNMSLGEVCSRMERWYDVHISIDDPSLAKSIHYTGVLSEETIADVMEALCELSAIRYRMTGNKITISKK